MTHDRIVQMVLMTVTAYTAGRRRRVKRPHRRRARIVQSYSGAGANVQPAI